MAMSCLPWNSHSVCEFGDITWEFSSTQIFIISRKKFIYGVRNNYQIKQDYIYHIHNIIIKPLNHVHQCLIMYMGIFTCRNSDDTQTATGVMCWLV